MIDQVTRAFPMIDSTAVAESLLRKAAGDPSLTAEKKQEIAGADIIKIAGGEITFLIGQQYMICEPDLIYRDPASGLGLFKSKYRTFHGGKQYILAGPMVGLRYLEGTGFNFTTFMGRVNNCRMITSLAPRLDHFPSDNVKEESPKEEEEAEAEELKNL